jgi:hypothetical protein
VIAALFEDWSPSKLTMPFWEAAREGRPVLQRCAVCGSWQHPPRPVCVSCGGGGSGLRWEPIDGAGTVFSLSVVERALIPELRGSVPYILILVELEEGPRMLSILTGSEPGSVSIGFPVRMSFVPFVHRMALPVFQPR